MGGSLDEEEGWQCVRYWEEVGRIKGEERKEEVGRTGVEISKRSEGNGWMLGESGRDTAGGSWEEMGRTVRGSRKDKGRKLRGGGEEGGSREERGEVCRRRGGNG